MRVWIPLDSKTVDALSVGQGIDSVSWPTQAFGLTPAWVMQAQDDDPEVLEDAILYEAGSQAHAVVVAQVSDLEVGQRSGTEGVVELTEPIKSHQILALFARHDLDDDFSWFGPSEAMAFCEFFTGK